jgi:mono/diheme cytochrome c family protein
MGRKKFSSAAARKLINEEKNRPMKIKTKTALFIAPIAFFASGAFAADAAANWNQYCAACHAKDGSGSTMMGKKLGVKDYRDAKVQAEFTDAQATQLITDGKDKMKAFKGKLSADEIKALVAYVRTFKK